jgi:hypothetical protein
MSISTPKVKPVPAGPVRVATAVLAAVLALVLASTTEAASPDTTTEATASQAGVPLQAPPGGHQLQRLKRVATKWARLFAVNDCTRYMRQSVCERLACHGKMGEPIENCTPVSAAFQQTFADATVEDIAIGWHGRHGGYRAAVKFSNGVVVLFNDGGGRWTITLPNRRFVRAATG